MKSKIIYLDNCIINEVIRNRELNSSHNKIKKDMSAICQIAISVSDTQFVMSPQSKKEFLMTPVDFIREELIDVYNWMQNISAPENELFLFPAQPDTEAMLPGGFNVIFPKKKLLKELEMVFDNEDSRHIFQAILGKCAYFLTIDYKTILNRLASNQAKLDNICPELTITSPSEFLTKVSLKEF